MPWQCRMVPAPTLEKGTDGRYQRIEIGDMWWEPEEGAHLICQVKHAGKRPLIVRLPGAADFAVYGPTWRDGNEGPGWDVTGDPPLVTVSPSINLVGVYHGYLRDGVISDDIEGRRYNVDGVLIRNGQRG